jgi:hypothetical protein
MMYCCVLERTNNETQCTGMYRYVLLHTAEGTNAEPPCTGIYRYVLVYTEIHDFGIYRYVRVCTFPEKYIRVCTGMYFSEKVYTDLYYSIVQAGTYRYIPVHTDLHQV